MLGAEQFLGVLEGLRDVSKGLRDSRRRFKGIQGCSRWSQGRFRNDSGGLRVFFRGFQGALNTAQEFPESFCNTSLKGL